MAVGLEYLGQQVRCPHCGGIVIAPREAPLPASSPTQQPIFSVETDSSEDIFSESPPGDSLFDEEPVSPVFPPSYSSPGVSPFDEPYNDTPSLAELPPEPAPPEPENGAPEVPPSFGAGIPSLSLDGLVSPSSDAQEAFPAAQPAPEEDSIPSAEFYHNGLASTSSQAATSPLAQEPTSPVVVPTPATAATWNVSPATSPTSPGSPSAPLSSPQQPAQEPSPLPVTPQFQQPFTPDPPSSRERTRSGGGGIGLFLPLVVLPLVVYAVGMTAAVVFLYSRLTNLPVNANPFEQMPDVDGDDPGVKLKKLTLRFGKQDALAELPARQVIGLKETLQIGDLEVTPLKVERRVVRIFDERQGKDGVPEPLPSAPLVLTLRVKNCAEDYRFTPMDNFFDRHWTGKSGSTPLTILMAGTQPFFGGPARWVPQKREGKRREFREWLEGRSNGDPRGLGPGESTETFVCTDGGDEATTKYLFGETLEGRKVGKPYSGNLLWRVQLRRGLITLGGKRYPATCVIGVRFTSRDYLAG
jgi:hypothetical protein